MRRNNLIGDLIAKNDRTKQPRELTIRRPAKDIFPPAAKSSCLLFLVTLIANYAATGSLSCVQQNSVPSLHNAMHDHRKPSGQGYNRLLPTAAFGDIHRPRFLATTIS
ncbi:hypothetical protein BN77_p2180033 [Rhizobium mesoamericanum STM3625]|uniref:Uncharacterized protein n=1 Tax=Rhizobium mesoamericanum STM3625 TaxID=1211777 RepID=K0Q5L3_9HYPH|nr:hypothetical protein BN77_p2180033 [Rhizobium mesoamericanum STM3625]